MTVQMKLPLSGPEVQRVPEPLPRRTRRDRMRALQFYLLNIHGSQNSWSDGDRVYSGEDLEDLRNRLVHQLIQVRAEIPLSRNAQAWQSVARLMQGQGTPQAVPLVERMVQQLRRAAADRDEKAKERARVLRRALRRKARREFDRLPQEVKATPKETAHLMAEIIQSMMGMNRVLPIVSTTFGVEGAAGSIVGQLFEAMGNPFEYTPEQEMRRGLRPMAQDA